MASPERSFRAFDWLIAIPALELFRCIGVAARPRVIAVSSVWLVALSLLATWRNAPLPWSPPVNVNLVEVQEPDLVDALFSAWDFWRIADVEAALFDRPEGSSSFAWGLTAILLLLVLTLMDIALVSVVSRLTAFEIARFERAALGDVVRYAAGRWQAYLGAVFIALGAALAAALPLMVLGFLVRWTALAWLLVVLAPLVLAAAVAATYTTVGLCFAPIFAWCAVSIDGSDAFDAISRGFSYLFHRPLKLLGYLTVAIVVGAIGWLMAALAASAFIYVTLNAMNFGGQAFAPEAAVYQNREFILSAASAGAAAWGRGVVLLARFLTHAWGVGYLAAAATGIYLLMRAEVDEAEIDDVPTANPLRNLELPPLKSEHDGEGGKIDAQDQQNEPGAAEAVNSEEAVRDGDESKP